MEKTEYKKARIWNWVANSYSKQPIVNEEAYHKKLEMIQKMLTPDMKVLEVGCGPGTTAIFLSPFVNHIEAIDISYKMIEIAKSKLSAKQDSNINFHVSSIEDLKGQEGSFDVIMAHSLLHLVENKEMVMQKFSYLLKPNGYFISSTLCIKEVNPLMGKIAPIGTYMGILPVMRSFDSKNLLSAIEMNGFNIEFKWQPSHKEAIFIMAKKA